jgi:hypothetical protein
LCHSVLRISARSQVRPSAYSPVSTLFI